MNDEKLTRKQMIIITICVAVIFSAAVGIARLSVKNRPAPEDDSTAPTEVNAEAYTITTSPVTETTIIEQGDRVIIRDAEGNETVDFTDPPAKANMNGGGGELPTDSKGTYNGEATEKQTEKATQPAKSSSPKDGDTKVENGKKYIYNSTTGMWAEDLRDKPSGLQPSEYTLTPEREAELATDGANFQMG